MGHYENNAPYHIVRLIINGDDFGYTLANTQGIIEAYHNGILRSTSALANSKYLLQAKALAASCPDLGIGVHLNLTLGEPLTKNKTLTDKDGLFFKGPLNVWKNNPDYDEIYWEWKAQIERFIEMFEKLPTHLDAHHNVHDRTSQALEVSLKLAKEYNIPLRGHNDFQFIQDFNSHKGTSVASMIQILDDHKGKDVEIMCHPGFCDLELYRASSNSLNRVVELDVLCSQEVKNYINENEIELVHY